MTTYVTGEGMQCPYCDTHLKCMDLRRYERLMEHAFNPNEAPTLKAGFGCQNEECEAHKAGLRWLVDGEGPYCRDKMPPHPTQQYPTPVNTLYRKIKDEQAKRREARHEA